MYRSLSPQMSLADLPDVALLKQVCAGDQLAFEALVERYQVALYRFATRLVGGEQAYDVLQFVWLQLYLTMPRLVLKSAALSQDTVSLKAWLFCIARNRCIDEIRRNRRRHLLFSELSPFPHEEDQSPLSEMLDSAPSPEEQAERHDEQVRLRNAIKTLPPKHRVVVWLRYSQELSFSEIGNKLHMSASTAKTYFYRSRLRLCTVLGEQPGA